MYSSFASALWFLGLTELAVRVDSEAVRSEGDPFALKRLANLVQNHPTWMIPKRMKNSATSFKLLEHDLTNALDVVVLKGIPDRACNHAITVFDGMIFDSNEKSAIPLTQANLDLMCSTDGRKAKYTMSVSQQVIYSLTQGKADLGFVIPEINFHNNRKAVYDPFLSRPLPAAVYGSTVVYQLLVLSTVFRYTEVEPEIHR